jgi:predicted Rossmann-fold nucleotide-binding protein
MEATHLGAWMAGRTTRELNDALKMLSQAPSFRDDGWLCSAFRVVKKYPQDRFVSLGIPTWLYGHEPSTPFATHIAKFFENSVREDNILTLAYGGLIYTPGSAGTMQEIFQEAVQNHYLSFGFASPMIFLGKKFWTEELPVYPLLDQLMKSGKYKNLLLTLTDDTRVVVNKLSRFFQAHKK